jgi:hypothetical protein
MWVFSVGGLSAAQSAFTPWAVSPLSPPFVHPEAILGALRKEKRGTRLLLQRRGPLNMLISRLEQEGVLGEPFPFMRTSQYSCDDSLVQFCVRPETFVRFRAETKKPPIDNMCELSDAAQHMECRNSYHQNFLRAP